MASTIPGVIAGSNVTGIAGDVKNRNPLQMLPVTGLGEDRDPRIVLLLLLHELIFNTIGQGLPTGLNDILRHPDRSPFFFLIT